MSRNFGEIYCTYTVDEKPAGGVNINVVSVSI
jgi:hypothetical protein